MRPADANRLVPMWRNGAQKTMAVATVRKASTNMMALRSAETSV
jgi:hypothetical protein